MSTICIGWTTVENREQADALARGLVEAKLAACVQVDGPIQSHYLWEGKLNCESEFRLAVKYDEKNAEAIAQYLKTHHPYETPQWLAPRAHHTLPEYLEWVLGRK